MPTKDTLVSIGLPVRNGVGRMEDVVRAVLAQDHERLELVICDNASTDDTEELCRGLAAADGRIVYHRQPENVGILNNFVHAMRLAGGDYFRWIGDDDWLAPTYVTRTLAEFTADDRLFLVGSHMAYTGVDGEPLTGAYEGDALRSDDPVERLTEMLRLLTETGLRIDPLYSMIRRAPLTAISRRNMLREDEVFAAKLALAGPWGHVPEVLGHRSLAQRRLPALARSLGVAPWQARFATFLQYREILSWLPHAGLTADQHRRARLAVLGMYLRRHRVTAAHRGRKLTRLVAGHVLRR
ncbi:glycosyltransferase family 2 protein [Streptosporangium soli]|nr:glycosyltransferase [Streptosporangium sp. KLBMP 9127]